MRLDEFRNIPFRMQDLSSVYPGCVNLATKAGRLEAAREIIRLKRGMYVVAPRISRVPLSQFLIANHLYGPSYVSMQAALRFYGLIPEAVHEVCSMTNGVARRYENSIGTFSYVHVPSAYYNVGVAVMNEPEASFMIASPAKALCDLMVFTPNLNLRYKGEIRAYLEEDIRFDMDGLPDLDVELIRECALHSRKQTMLNQLIKFIADDRNI